MTVDMPVAIVTGAGGALGQEIAATFAAEGYKLALMDRTEELLGNSVEAALDAGAPEARTYIADQTRRDAVETAMAAIRADLGPIGILVANAGFARLGAFENIEGRTWDRHMNVNLTGTFNVCQATAQRMIADRIGGAICVVSSCLAVTHSDQNIAYCTSKAALLTMVRSMAAELGIHRIRANCVLPGVIETAMTRMVLDQPGQRAALLAETPMGRTGVPADVARAIFFLCSAEAGFITGAELLVDGGQSIYGQPTWIRQDRSIPHTPRWISTAVD